MPICRVLNFTQRGTATGKNLVKPWKTSPANRYMIHSRPIKADCSGEITMVMSIKPHQPSTPPLKLADLFLMGLLLHTHKTSDGESKTLAAFIWCKKRQAFTTTPDTHTPNILQTHQTVRVEETRSMLSTLVRCCTPCCLTKAPWKNCRLSLKLTNPADLTAFQCQEGECPQEANSFSRCNINGQLHHREDEDSKVSLLLSTTATFQFQNYIHSFHTKNV